MQTNAVLLVYRHRPSECKRNAIVVLNEVVLYSVIDPVTLTFEPQNSTHLGYTKIIPYTKFEHFGIIRFRVMLHTNRRTRKFYPRHAGNKSFS